MAPDQHWFVFNHAHLLVDGWSMAILLHDVRELYDAFAAGRAPRPVRARPFADFIAWLQKQDPAREAAFWRETLAGFSAPTPLGVDQRVEGGEPRFASRYIVLPEADGAALEAFMRRHKLTPSTLMHAAMALLLSRYSGEEDLLFGTTVAGRSAPLPDIERMVGPFINTLPVRAAVLPTRGRPLAHRAPGPPARARGECRRLARRYPRLERNPPFPAAVRDGDRLRELSARGRRRRQGRRA